MKVIDCSKNIKCELGACKNRSTREIVFDRVGIRGRIHLCDKCLNELYSAIGEAVVPKSVETAKKRDKASAVKKPNESEIAFKRERGGEK
ncbi:MAG: hypothetical protein J1F33_07035 [Clostridiales bacterium]|nr:hypothetical protein [Clostridiales bacterium]